MIRIDKDSYGSVAMAYIVAAVIMGLIYWLSPFSLLNHSLLVIAIVIVIWQTLFFRVPNRDKAGDHKKVTAVADGDVVVVEKVFEPEFLKKECIQVSIYMDFWNVHANFWPVDGEVTYYKYHPGKHFFAFRPKASTDNEHSCTCVQTPDGKEIFFKQLAGTFARRIVSYSTPGLKTVAGEQCGIIKFGSRIDMFIPLDAKICVKIGDKTRACETVIAEL